MVVLRVLLLTILIVMFMHLLFLLDSSKYDSYL